MYRCIRSRSRLRDALIAGWVHFFINDFDVSMVSTGGLNYDLTEGDVLAVFSQ